MLYFKKFITERRGSAEQYCRQPVACFSDDRSQLSVALRVGAKQRTILFSRIIPGFFVGLSVEPLDFFSEEVELD